MDNATAGGWYNRNTDSITSVIPATITAKNGPCTASAAPAPRVAPSVDPATTGIGWAIEADGSRTNMLNVAAKGGTSQMVRWRVDPPAKESSPAIAPSALFRP